MWLLWDIHYRVWKIGHGDHHFCQLWKFAQLQDAFVHACASSARLMAFKTSILGTFFYANRILYRTSSTACAALDTIMACTPTASSCMASMLPTDSATSLNQHSNFTLNDKDCAWAHTLRHIQDGLDALGHSDRKVLADGLQKCTSLTLVKVFHHRILSTHGQDAYLANLLVSMYARHGALQDSRAVFDQSFGRTVVTWTSIITALAKQELSSDAFSMYRRMQEEGTLPNNVTFISLLSACTTRAAFMEGKKIHARIDKTQLADVVLSTAMVTMYGRCGSVEDARTLFDQLPNVNNVSWNAMITMYVNHEHGKEALLLFQKMQSEGFDPDDCTYINSLKACALLEDVVQGKEIHWCIVESGLMSDIVVSNALLNMYGKCGASSEALYIFTNMEQCDRVAWNGLITAYAQQGLGLEGLEVFRNMQQQGLKADKVTFIGVIGAIASVTALKEGKGIHACLLYDGLLSDLQIGNALIHMYGRCGALGAARLVFDNVQPHSVVTWTAIIAAFAQQGHAKAALQLFKEMQEECVKPDEITYIMVLSACGHSGLVEEGRSCFVSMEKHGLTPNVEHYVCMIDLLGRAGLLSEAEEFIRKIPRWHDNRLWAALLGSCTLHSDTFRGKNAAEQMLSFGKGETAPYILLANLYAGDIGKDISKISTLTP